MIGTLLLLALAAPDAGAPFTASEIFQIGRTIAPARTFAPGVQLQFEFDTPGDYPNGTLALGTAPLSVTRSSVATYENPPGTIVTAAANRARVEVAGLLVEGPGTNYALNSGTHPKTNEATAVLGNAFANTWVAWHAGTGTLTVTAGTLAVTGGLPCTALAAGTPCVFTTGAGASGTMLLTTTAGTTRVQVEFGGHATSYVASAGTAAVRQPDQITAAAPAEVSPYPNDASRPFCWMLRATARGGWTAITSNGNVASANRTLFGLRNGTGTRNPEMLTGTCGGAGANPCNPGNLSVTLQTNGLPDYRVSTITAPLSPGEHAINASWERPVNGINKVTYALDGAAPATTYYLQVGSTNYATGPDSSTFYFGRDWLQYFNGWLRSVKVYAAGCSEVK